MSIYGDWKAATIANNGTSSSAVDLGRDYDFIEVQLPAVTSCTLKLQISETLGGTYYDLGSSMTTETTTGGFTDTWYCGHRYIKVVSSATQLAERLIRVRGMRF